MFYQLYAMLFLLGNRPAESFATLRHALALLVALQAGDPTLEFKNALTPERLFLDRYPDLAPDFRPVALGLLSRGGRRVALSSSERLPLRLLPPAPLRGRPRGRPAAAPPQRRPRLPRGPYTLGYREFHPGSGRHRYAGQLAPSLARVVDAFFDDPALTLYFLSLLLLCVLDGGRCSSRSLR